eukprot:CAMPEP_0117433000 /NCGR_PEP_ID=MMETSP0758-20121206/12422_1 /TAXON_ID=63605 /ORGANISM="Percolomonas cosmopolitus, Strain AE-1 (ATCC 50343)" /LENGTH=2577 /DNA_ID=CAMNT_0005223347 /DNA_START=40 /DNA_END=7770 /DNA_ORIENTATION=-
MEEENENSGKSQNPTLEDNVENIGENDEREEEELNEEEEKSEEEANNLKEEEIVDRYLKEETSDRIENEEKVETILSILTKPTTDEVFVKQQKEKIKSFEYGKVNSEYLDNQILRFSSGKGIVRLSAEEQDIVEMKSEQYETRTINNETMGGKTFFLFGPSSMLRRIAFWLVTNRLYEHALDLIMLINVVMMAIQPPFVARNENTTLYMICEYVDIACIAIYTIDVLLKMLVKGVVLGKYTYLRESAWNLFDLNVVVIGWSAIIVQFALPQYFVNYHFNASTLKCFKLIRVLMHFKVFQEIRAIVDSISESLNFMVNVVSFLVFFFVVFGIMGVEFYQNSQNCTVSGVVRSCFEAIPTQYCGKEGNVLGSFVCPGDQVCISEGLTSPNFGFTNFNNMFYSFLTMFQVATLTGWTDLMYPLMNSENEYLTMVWFFVMIVLMSFIIINLFMAIVTSLFEVIREKQIEEQEQEKEKKRLEKDMDRSKLSPFKRLRYRIRDLLTIQPLHYIPGIRNLKRRAEEIIQDPFFNFVSLCFVFIHLIIQSTEYYGMSTNHLYVLNAASVFFFFFYVGESFIRLFGSLSIYRYISDVFNQMDIVLLIIQGTGIILYSLGNEDTFLYKLGFLRALRLLPLLQMIKLDSTRHIRGLLNSTMGGVIPTLKMLLFMLYVIFIVAIMGHQLFGKRIFPSEEDRLAGNTSRDNFDSIPLGMITLFKIMTNDDWTATLYEGMSLQNDGWIAGIFFILYYIVASAILFNIFTAIILEKFEVSEEERQEYKKVVTGKKQNRNVVLEKIQNVALSIQEYVTKDPEQLDQSAVKGDDSTETLSEDDEDAHFKKQNPYVDDKEMNERLKKIYTTDAERYNENYDIVCFCLKSSNPFRKVIRVIVRNVWFDRLMAVIVILSTIAMMLEPAREANLLFTRPRWQEILIQVLYYSEWVFLVIFILEFLLKVISNGFLLTKDGSGYFEDPWNFFDFLLIIVMILTTALKTVIPSELYIIRVLRTLRPLRVLRSIPGLKPILDSVYSSLFSMLTVLAASIYIQFLFGVAGVAIFNGKFHQCSDPTVTTRAQCSGFKPNDLGVLTHREWSAPRTNFDNIGWAMFSLTEVASLSEWAVVMYKGMDVVGVDRQPQRDFAPYYSIYFILYILVGSFFVLNIVIAVILDAYKANRDGHLLSEQNDWVDAKREMLLLTPKRLVKPPQGFFNGKFNPLLIFYKIMEIRVPFVKSKPRVMEILFAICIIINTVFLLTIGISGFRTFFTADPNPWDTVLSITNWVFVGIYLFEMCLKILAYRKYYFLDPWNIFDFIVTIGSLIAAILSSFQFSNSFVMLMIAFISRIFRVGRVFKLIPYFSGLNFMFHTLVNSIPGIINITFLLIGLLIIYAIIALELYGALKFQTGINHNSNFRDLWTASVTLFRLATLDNWNILLNDVTNSLPYCTTTPTFDDCGSKWAYIYFFSYYVIGAYVFLNLVIAVILDNFAIAYNNIGASDFYVNTFDYDAFIESWKQFDNDANGFIELSKLDLFIQHMYERLIDEDDDGVARNNLAFSVFKNKKAFTLLKYELKLELEPLVRSEAENNIFMIIQKWIMKYYHRLLMHRKKKERGKKERMISFHQTLYLLSKYAVPHKSFTYEESQDREEKLKVAIVNNAIYTIERFYEKYVRSRVQTRLKLHENHAAALKELGQQDEKDPLRAHILHDLDSSTSSIVDEMIVKEKDQRNFIEYEFAGKQLDEIFETYPNEQQLYTNLKMRSLSDRSISLKNPVNLANDPDFEPFTKYLLDPHYRDVLEQNGFRLSFMPSCFITKKELLYHLFKDKEAKLRSIFYNNGLLDLLLSEYPTEIMEILNVHGHPMSELTFKKKKSKFSVDTKMQPITFENKSFTKIQHMERNYGSHYMASAFPYPIHENSILNKLNEEEDGHYIISKYALNLSGVFGASYSLLSKDLGLPDLLENLRLIRTFDRALRKNYGDVNDGIRFQLVKKGFYMLRPAAILKFFKSSAYKVFRNAALREKRVSTILMTDQQREQMYKEAYRQYFKDQFIEEHFPNIDISVYCSSFDMSQKRYHDVDGVRQLDLNDFIPRQKYDVYALTFSNAFTTDEDTMRAYVETAMSGDYALITSVQLRDLFLFVFAKEKFISSIDEDIHTDSMMCNNVLINCGAVSAKVCFNQTTFSFIGCALPPNDINQKVSSKFDNTRERNELLQSILDTMTDEHHVDVLLASDHLFIMGSMNYCVEMPYAGCEDRIKTNDFAGILAKDQLTMERKNMKVLRHFHEATIQFAPSRVSLLDRKRSMSYPDRVLWKSQPGYSISCVKYNSFSIESPSSPVYGVYICNRLVFDKKPAATVADPTKLAPPKFTSLTISTEAAEQESKYGLQFMSIELSGRTVDKDDNANMILRPRFEMNSKAFANDITVVTEKGCCGFSQIKVTDRMIPFIQLRLSNLSLVQLQHIQLVLRDGRQQSSHSRKIGRGVLALHPLVTRFMEGNGDEVMFSIPFYGYSEESVHEMRLSGVVRLVEGETKSIRHIMTPANSIKPSTVPPPQPSMAIEFEEPTPANSIKPSTVPPPQPSMAIEFEEPTPANSIKPST